jgi:protein required for attachment to host cells
MTRAKTWALVSNGLHAQILRDLEQAAGPAPIVMESQTDSPHLGDMLSDRPGRSFASDGSGRRAALEPGSDPILHDMQVFAREIVQCLEDHHRNGALTRLAVFAAPRMLGVLRDQMPEALGAATILERDLNLINLPEAELRATVRRAIGEVPAS